MEMVNPDCDDGCHVLEEVVRDVWALCDFFREFEPPGSSRNDGVAPHTGQSIRFLARVRVEDVGWLAGGEEVHGHALAGE